MASPVRKPVTSYDVARVAGVSQSAVSRAFTEGAKIAPATREKVFRIASELGYRPSFIARSLITRKSNLIGVVVPGLQNPFFSAVLDALSCAVNAMGYRVLLFSMLEDNDTDPYMEEVLRHRVEALILVSSSLSSHFARECQRTGLPVLLLNRENDDDSVSSVTSDNVTAGEEIARFLLACGHKQLAFLAGRQTSSTSRDREIGFTGWLQKQGIELVCREQGDWTVESAMAATRRMMSTNTFPDAIFCANDIMAVGAINVIVAEMKLVPGQDISVVGFDDTGMAAWPMFSLTTWVQPIDEMISHAVSILKILLKSPDSPPVRLKLQGGLVVRGSTRSPATT